ncbi:hypothetical protein A2188_00985 [Candidatus Woesebacteria bacterium RIFOXYA1_FULL_43_9]|uniref:Regulatory protein RecX n=1 Tax=Candidatus Woesebacteria bacterium RIFOXYA1_FULL_43_9 TaxID=1802534 RepID=A0A1F8CK83_9BACT|nr:MAG: hypothetical protein A2188_00985 [Candidatus Woesebacteria bacterium RIFOXYA1_FULL_43_9]
MFEKLARFVGIRPRSEREIDLWLRKKKVDTKEALELKEKLMTLDLMDDLAFATWWIDQRNTFRPKGKKLLVYELKQKGVKSGVIEEALEASDFNERELAKKVVAKYVQREPEKLVTLLQRRGFSWETISGIIPHNDNEG